MSLSWRRLGCMNENQIQYKVSVPILSQPCVHRDILLKGHLKGCTAGVNPLKVQVWQVTELTLYSEAGEWS
jgi:hypothetical protein